MKKSLTKVVINVAVMLSVAFALIYAAVYLSGVWKINAWGVKLSFGKNMIVWGQIVVYAAFGLRKKIGELLSTHEAELEYEDRKKWRHMLRRVFCSAWFMTYGCTFALGQANHWHDVYQHLGKLDLIDLGLVYLCGIIFFCTVIPMPKQPKESKKSTELKTIDN